jgi:hypothetical protein
VIRRFAAVISSVAVSSLLLGALFGPGVSAQGPGDPGEPPGRPFGPPPGGPGGPMGPPRHISPVDLPLNVLARELMLTAGQKAQIAPIQEQFQQTRRELMPPPPEPGSPPPDWESMRAGMEKLHAQEQRVSDRIQAILSLEQKQALPSLLKGIEALRAAGLPPTLYHDLKLTADQKKQIAAIGASLPDTPAPRGSAERPHGRPGAVPPPPGPPDGFRELRQQTREKVLAVLTAEQRKSLEEYRRARPRPGPGEGFGPPPGPPPDGFGPPPGGGPRDE